jgi:hypothetical protein
MWVVNTRVLDPASTVKGSGIEVLKAVQQNVRRGLGYKIYGQRP